MLERGLTITSLAEQIGCSRSHLSGVLAGLKPIPAPLAAELARLLDLDESLLRREEVAAP